MSAILWPPSAQMKYDQFLPPYRNDERCGQYRLPRSTQARSPPYRKNTPSKSFSASLPCRTSTRSITCDNSAVRLPPPPLFAASYYIWFFFTSDLANTSPSTLSVLQDSSL